MTKPDADYATHVRFKHFDDYGPDYRTEWFPLPLSRSLKLYHLRAMEVEYKSEPPAST